MTIVAKLRLGGLLLAFIPSVLIGVLIGWTAVGQSTETLKNEAHSRLVSLRENRANQIESLFQQIREHLLVTAGTISTQRGLGKLTDSYNAYFKEANTDSAKDRQDVESYYRGAFASEYAKQNGSKQFDSGNILNKLDPTELALQARMIALNPNPVGKKDEFLELNDETKYARWHKFFHPTFRKLLQGYGYSDAYLVDGKTDNIVYSVHKEIDFATSLKAGPFADSGLGDAYRKVMAIDSNDKVAASDFSPYLPSYEAPVAFIGAPIFYKGEKIGAIIFQVPSKRLEAVMTSNRQWKESGMGESGETYLVGADLTMRSESRMLLEAPEAFSQLLKNTGTSKEVIDQIANKNTVVGIHKVDSTGVREALAGKSGFAIFEDYRGVEVVSAYRPINTGGMNWAILAEMDTSEAFAAASELRETVIYNVAIVTLLITVAAAVIAFLFANSINRPLREITDSMNDISAGEGDLTVRLNEKGKDELAELAGAFNRFVIKIDNLIGEVRVSTDSLSTSAEKLSLVTQDSRDGAGRQQREIEHIATAVEEMTTSVSEVANSTSQTASAAEQTGIQVETGREVLQRNLAAIQKLSNRIQESQVIVDALGSDSERVGTVLEVISSVAEQTNLLALNAAIEAARAGEQGRGFAVVADEVRILAQRTQESAEEIRQIIESLQSRSKETIKTLEMNNAELKESVSLSESTQESFLKIEEAVNTLLTMSAQIASATEQQSATTTEISQNVHSIHQVATDSLSGADETAASSNELAALGSHLNNLVSQFKVSR